MAPAPKSGAEAGAAGGVLVPDVALVALSPPSLKDPKPPSPVDWVEAALLSVLLAAAALPKLNDPVLVLAGLGAVDDAPPKDKLGVAEVLDSAGLVPKLKLPPAGVDVDVLEEGAAPKLKPPVEGVAGFEPPKEKAPAAGADVEPAAGVDPKPVLPAGVPNANNGLFG